MRRMGALVGLTLAVLTAPALAQDTAAQDAAKRLALMSQLPADAAKRVFGQVKAPAAMGRPSRSAATPGLPGRRGGIAARRAELAGDAPVAQAGFGDNRR